MNKYFKILGSIVTDMIVLGSGIFLVASTNENPTDQVKEGEDE